MGTEQKKPKRNQKAQKFSRFLFGVTMALRATQGTSRIVTALRRVARPFSTDAVVESDYKRGEIGKVSGIPEEHLSRKVIIYSPARVATQQGSGKLGKWKINFVSTLKWENPLMGWTSTGDPYANVGDSALEFDSEEAAKSFVERHGWDYKVKKPKTPLLKAKSYSDNFKWKGKPQPEN